MPVDQVSSAASGATGATSGVTGGLPGGGGLGMLTSGLQGGVSNVINLGSSTLDKFFPPEKRAKVQNWLTKFATERPYLASFLLSQLALSGPAIALFVIMSLTVFIFSLIAGILVGVLGALFFIVLAIGFALLFLLPVLFFTTAAAVFIWLWGMGAYYIVKWFNQKEIPGVTAGSSAGGATGQVKSMGDLSGLLGGGGGGDSTAPAAKSAAPRDGTKVTRNMDDLPSSYGESGAGHEQGQVKGHKAEKAKPTTNGTGESRKAVDSPSKNATTKNPQHYTDGKENLAQAHPQKVAGKAQAGIGSVSGVATGLVK